MRGFAFPSAATLAFLLGACSLTPTQGGAGAHAYWSDPSWQAQLLRSVQSVVHQADGATPIVGVNAMVRFTLVDGIIKNPQIVASTGYTDLDTLLLRQVASANLPKPVGPHANEPHEFELLLDMPSPFDSMLDNIYRAIDDQKVFPKSAIIDGAVGDTTVDFDYLDAQVRHVVITRSSGNDELDKASADAVAKAAFPPTPHTYAGKSTHLAVVFCYSIAYSRTEIRNVCPDGANVIDVEAVLVAESRSAIGGG